MSVYNFRANNDTHDDVSLKHLKTLQNIHPKIFEFIPSLEKLAKDAEAVNIITSACKTVSLALRAHEQFLKTGKPFFLALAENHTNPAHKLHHMLVLRGLKEHDIPFSCSKENGADFLLDTLHIDAQKFKTGKHEVHKSQLKTANTDLLITQYSLMDHEYAPYTEDFIFCTFLRNLYHAGTQITLSDTPHYIYQDAENTYPSNYLDTRNALTSSIIYSSSFQKQWQEALTSNMSGNGNFFAKYNNDHGMALRNEYAIKMVTPKSKAPDIHVVHIGGTRHIYNELSPNDNSTVLAFANKAGYHPIGIILRGDPKASIDAINATYKRSPGYPRYQHLIYSMPEPWFDHNLKAIKSMISGSYSWESYFKEEMDFVNPKLKLFGFNDLIIPNLDAIEKAWEKNKDSVNASLRELIQETHPIMKI